VDETPADNADVGITIRPADASDADRIASVHSTAWQAAFTFLPSRFLEAMTPAAVLGQWTASLADPKGPFFVAAEGGLVVGFLMFRADGDEGEVLSLYVHPSAWSRGVGSALLALGETSLLGSGVQVARLWTAKDSQQSRQFYEHRGWLASGREQTQYLGPANVALDEVEYWKPLT
jgi:ribosomal protein S18 acetylase RimI-like enzyme